VFLLLQIAGSSAATSTRAMWPPGAVPEGFGRIEACCPDVRRRARKIRHFRRRTPWLAACSSMRRPSEGSCKELGNGEEGQGGGADDTNYKFYDLLISTY